MVMTRRRQRTTVESTNSSAAEATAAAGAMTDFVAPRIERCNATSPMLMKCEEPAFIAVDVYGEPAPIVRWHVGNRRVQKSSKYRATASGRRHTLAVLKVSEELEKGVWVMATNEAGEDSCLITIKTYKVLSGMRNSSFHEARNSSFHESILSVKESSLMLRRNETLRTARPFSPEPEAEVFPEHVEQELTSPEGLIKPAVSLEDWQREMEVRNRMRSVDDLRYYSQWRRESMHGSVSGSTTGLMSTSHDPLPLHASADIGGSMSLNQSFMTDDGGGMELRQSIRRRRKVIRVRSRSASASARSWCASGDSVASAPAARNPPSISFPPPPTTLPSPPRPVAALNNSFDPAPKPPIDRNGDLRRASTRRSTRSRRKKPTSAEESGKNTVADVEVCEPAVDIQLSSTDIDAIDGPFTEAFGEIAAESSPVGSCYPVTRETDEDLWEMNGVPLNVLCHRILYDDVFHVSAPKILNPVKNVDEQIEESEEFAAAEADTFSADKDLPPDSAVIETDFQNIIDEQTAGDLGSGRSSPAFSFPAPPTPPPRIDPPPLPTIPPPSELPTPESLLNPGLELKTDDDVNRASLKRRKKKKKSSLAVSALKESTASVTVSHEEEIPAFVVAVNSTLEQSAENPVEFTDDVLLSVPGVSENEENPSEIPSDQPPLPAGDSYVGDEGDIEDFAVCSEGNYCAEPMLVPDLLSEIGNVPHYNGKFTETLESEFPQTDFSVVAETDFAYEEDQVSANDETDNAVDVLTEAEHEQSVAGKEVSAPAEEDGTGQPDSDYTFPSAVFEDGRKLLPDDLAADSKFANVDFIDDDENSSRGVDYRTSIPEQLLESDAATAALKVEDLISSAESQATSASARMETNVVTWHEYGEMIKCVPDYDRDRAPPHSAGAAGMLDVQAILSQTVNLQKILETINSLTEGRLLQGWNGSPSTANDDRNRSRNDSANQLHDDLNDDLNGSDAAKSSRAEKHVKLTAKKPDMDPHSDDSVDFDAESYDCEMSPAAADLVDSIHLATAEDDEDLDDLDSDPDEYDYGVEHLPKSAPANCYSTAL